MSQKKEGKEKVPNPVLSLEEIEKAKGLSVEPSSKRRRFLTAEKKFDLFLESCRSPGRIGEMLRREGLYHTDLARIRAIIEEGALAALRSVRPGKAKVSGGRSFRSRRRKSSLKNGSSRERSGWAGWG